MTKTLRCISIAIAAALAAGLLAPRVTAAKPVVTIEGLPNTIKAPKSSVASYQLIGYIDGVYDENALWSIAGGDAAGVTLDPASGVLTVTPALAGTWLAVRCASGGYTATQNLYIGERSLSQGALAWVAANWAEAAGMPQKAVDGDDATYWGAGAHSVGSTARLCIDKGTARYNKIKLNFNHLTNSTQTILSASDTSQATPPAQSGVGNAPALSNGTVLYNRAQPSYEKTAYIDVAENNMRYLLFESKTESVTNTPFRLNEISLFYVLPGDMRISGVENEVEIPRSGSAVYRLDAALYDTVGQPMDSAAYHVAWTASTPAGVVFDSEKRTLTVASAAREGTITLTAVCEAGGVTLVTQKSISLIKGKISVYDSLMREVNQLDKAGTYYAGSPDAGAGHKVIFAKYKDGGLVDISVSNGDEKARLYIDPAIDTQVKAFFWDDRQQPYARVWKTGGALAPERNVALIEKNFYNGAGGTGLSGFYRVGGSVSAANGRLSASVDRYGIWTHLIRPAGESIVLDTAVGVSVPAELYVRDTAGNELAYPLETSGAPREITMLFNRSKNVCVINDGPETDISHLGELDTVGIRAGGNVTITLEYLRCYTGTRRNESAAQNDYTHFERTPLDPGFTAARAEANNAVAMAVDYDIAVFYGDRVKLPAKPRDQGGVPYVPVEAVGLLGGTMSEQSGGVTASFGPNTELIPVSGGCIAATALASLMGKTLSYEAGVITLADSAPSAAADSIRQMLYYYRPAAGEILEATKALGARPRILANQAVFDRVEHTLATDLTVAGWYQKLFQTANSYLTQPVSEYKVIDGRLLAVSNAVYDRVSSLGFVYRRTGDEKYARRAWEELEAAATFSDWHPRHFLDVGQMSLAFAVGYDWLYDYLTQTQKQVLVKAFEQKGLAEFVSAIHKGSGWPSYSSNWNIWIRNGVLSCVLSMAEDLNDTGAAAFALEKGIVGLESMLNEFAPKGAWFEGTAYWEATTKFTAQLIDALEYATGRYWGYDNLPGMDKTGYYSSMLTGPGGVFNFSDTTVRRDNAAAEFWLANRFGDPGLRNLRLQNIKTYNLATNLLDILWYVPSEDDTLPSFSNDIFYESIDVAAFHNGWTTTSLFAAVKGADTGASHFHYDGGNFIFDMGGKRFAYELGRDGYATTPDTASRNLSYKIRAEGHNVLVINPSADPGQRVGAAANIVKYGENSGERHALIDMTPMYQDRGLDDGYTGSDIRRGIKVFKNTDTILVQDEVHLTRASKMYWFMHTQGIVTLSEGNRKATINQGGVIVTAEILGDTNAQFSVKEAWILPTTPELPGQGQNTAYKKLTIYWENVQNTSYAVRFTRGASGDGTQLVPLAGW